MFVPTRSIPSSPIDVDALDLAWLAGLLEGEGSFMTGPPSSPRLPAIQMTMVDEDVVQRAARIMGCRVFTIKPRKRNWKVAYAIRLRGESAVAWMRALRPLLGSRRQLQVDAALASYAPRNTTKLSDNDARSALDLLRDGKPVREVATRFAVSIWCIYDLRLGRTHRHLSQPGSEERPPPASATPWRATQPS
jgi:hypothetical protein